jgi:hypothetical protein
MPSTVFANQRGVAHKSSHQGATIAAFPDVCKTPTPGGPVPIPYPTAAGSGQQNTAASKNTSATAVSKNTSGYGTNLGDEAGSLGMMSHKNMEEDAFKQARGHQLR